jgi:ubiquinone/menaquinone biosynthesis C-methylase UbiE
MSTSTPDHKSIYNEAALNYERLVSREDHQGNILKAIQGVLPLQGIDVVELGAGTGRVTRLLAPLVNSIAAFDSSAHMLQIAADSLAAAGRHNWRTGVADHRALPVDNASVDLCISGWSICYLVDWNRQAWKADVEQALAEMERVLKPGGTTILIETQGTGFTSPHAPDHLVEYYQYLTERGFQSKWFRTDYRFNNEQEAVESSVFFFGEEVAQKIKGMILPECTGLWWKRKTG